MWFEMTAKHGLLIGIGLCVLAGTVPAAAQGTATQYYIGSFQGEVVIKDCQTPGRPGYYYFPDATRYPTFAEQYDHPVRCAVCGHWRELGETCDWCGAPADRYEATQAQRGAIYSPYPIPGQYWYQKPMRSLLPPANVGWPYVNPSW